MISGIVIAVLAVALAIAIYIIFNQKTVHALELNIERHATNLAHETVARWQYLHGIVVSDFAAFKNKVETDAKLIAGGKKA